MLLLEDKWGENEQIYIVLFDTKTAFSSLAYHITKSKWNHISISFTRDIQKLFSFDYASNGFREETLQIYKRGTEYMVYSAEVPKGTIKELEKEIERIKGDPSYAYSLSTMIKAGYNRMTRKARFIFNEVDGDAMICSTFVQHLLRKAGINFYSDNRVMSPSDFLRRRRMKFLYKGVVK